MKFTMKMEDGNIFTRCPRIQELMLMWMVTEVDCAH